MTPRPATVYLGLGANLGDRKGNILRAIDLLKERVAVERVSSLYESAPVGFTEQPDFLNAVYRVEAELPPSKLLAFGKRIEASMGRAPGFRNAPRLIDIDILLYGDEVLRSPGLEIPHPRMAERPFVLVPLAEIAPKLPHPVLLKTMEELLAETAGADSVRLYAE